MSLNTSCPSFTLPSIPNAHAFSITSNFVQNTSLPEGVLSPGIISPPLDFCNVTLGLTHPGDNDTVYVTVWLPPADKWNSRYEATGGGGLAAGFILNMVQPLTAGFATSSTDAGLTLNNTIDPNSALWGLQDDGKVNDALLLNLAYRSIHDMAVVSKDIVSQFYGVPPRYSYWGGCSQGGRQGFAAASQYPDDFDGILANAPALDMNAFGAADYWAPVVMHNEGEVVPACVLAAFQRGVVEACDSRDGVVDGIISDYEVLVDCPFNSSALVGRTVPCKEASTTTNITITPRHATIAHKILDGPHAPDGERLWYGLAPGATFQGVANSTRINKTLVVTPFPPSANWIEQVLINDPTTDTTKLSYAQFAELFKKSITTGAMLGMDPINVTAFRNAGGKLLSWVGMADEYIPPTNLLKYHDTVREDLGSLEAVEDFFRLFPAPGGGHCIGGDGPLPIDPMGALMDWVENGNPPEILSAKTIPHAPRQIERDLCLYPRKPVYVDGDVAVKGSFRCEMVEDGSVGNDTSVVGDEDGDKNSAASRTGRVVKRLWVMGIVLFMFCM